MVGKTLKLWQGEITSEQWRRKRREIFGKKNRYIVENS